MNIIESKTSKFISTEEALKDIEPYINNQVVFQCRKCKHLIFTEVITKEKLQELMKLDCPNCGEEAYGLWTLLRMGNYMEEYQNYYDALGELNDGV